MDEGFADVERSIVNATKEKEQYCDKRSGGGAGAAWICGSTVDQRMEQHF